MAFSTKRRIYEGLPPLIKRSVQLSPFSWWAGKTYRAIYRRGTWFDQAGREELYVYQERELGQGSKNDVPCREFGTDYVDKLNANIFRNVMPTVWKIRNSVAIGSLEAIA